MPSFHSAGTLPVDHTLVMTLCKALLIGFSAPFRSSAVMQRVKIPSQKCHIWNRRPWFAYSLCNFYGATMMIKGSLLLSTPIVKHFRSKRTSPALGQNLTVFGINRDLTLSLSFITPKRHILAWFHIIELLRVKIHQPVWPVRESQKKRYKISPICPGAPSGCNHCCSRLVGFDSVRGQNWPSPIDLAGRR